MICRAWAYCQSEPGFYFALFVTVWMSAWVTNGLKWTSFDLAALRELFAFILGKYTVDSGLNSPWQKPIKEGQK